MFRWLRNLFSSKVETAVQETTTTTVAPMEPTFCDKQAIATEAPYIAGITTEPVAEAPKPKKKRYYKPKPKADGASKPKKPASETAVKPKNGGGREKMP